LLRRNAEAEERALAARHPADQRLLEQGSDAVVEELALLAQRFGPGDFGEVDAVQPCHEVSRADEAAEQASATEIAVEGGDTALAVEATPVPVGSRPVIEIGGDVAVEVAAVGAVLLAGELAHHGLVVRQVAERGKLQTVQRHMVRIEIDDVDAGGVARQVGEHVAAA